MDERSGRSRTAVFETLKPGSARDELYESLENVLRARTGGLIVVGDTPEIMSMVNGGFKIDAEMHPSALYELAKMDGDCSIQRRQTHSLRECPADTGSHDSQF